MEITLGVLGAYLGLSAVVVGLVEALKRGLKIPIRLVPLTSVVVGVVLVYLVNSFVLSGVLILAGVVLGLTACGLYSGGQASFSKSE